jgi:hypothetical protein
MMTHDAKEVHCLMNGYFPERMISSFKLPIRRCVHSACLYHKLVLVLVVVFLSQIEKHSLTFAFLESSRQSNQACPRLSISSPLFANPYNRNANQNRRRNVEPPVRATDLVEQIESCNKQLLYYIGNYHSKQSQYVQFQRCHQSFGPEGCGTKTKHERKRYLRPVECTFKSQSTIKIETGPSETHVCIERACC